jgi:branched-chain amino acid transport system permease protein
MNGTKGKTGFVVLGILLAALLLIPLFIKQDYFLSIVFLVGLYTILSQSWNIFGGYCGQINLGQAAFFGVGALSARYIWVAGIPYFLSVFGGGLAAVLLSGVIGIPSLKLKGHYFAIGTLALAMISVIMVTNMLPGVNFLPPALSAGYSLIERYYLALLVAGGTVWGTHVLARSKLGLAMLSIREDEDAAEAIGIRTFRYKVVSLVISSFVAGVAGGLFAIYSASFYRYVPFELWWSFDPVLITFIGGSGTVIGPVIGSICYVILKEIFAISLGQVNVLIFGAVFILIVLFLPKGLVGMLEKIRTAKKTLTLTDRG